MKAVTSSLNEFRATPRPATLEAGGRSISVLATELPDLVPGFFVRVLGRGYIVVNSNLTIAQKRILESHALRRCSKAHESRFLIKQYYAQGI